jgi:hypothetical protein
MLGAARDVEREVLGAFDPVLRDAPAPGGEWSAKDIQAHLAAWRQWQVDRMAAIRQGRPEPAQRDETDAVNAVIHAERADWPWDRVLADAEATATDLVAEVEAATDETLVIDRINATVLGNGPEHTLTHLTGLADRVDLGTRITNLAAELEATVAQDDWPARHAAFSRYNLACYHALGGRLDEARRLLRQALPVDAELQTFALTDDDLIALRDDIPSLMEA